MKITKRFRFEAAHRLMLHEGACQNLHGHSYKVEVTADGAVDDETGMVLDFSILSKAVKSILLGDFLGPPWDHSILLNYKDPLAEMLKEHFPKFRITTFMGEPTAELMAATLLDLSSQALKGMGVNDVFIRDVKMWETENNFAEINNY